MRYLLDTNVVSELPKADRHEGVTRLLETTPEASLLLSVVTIAELHKGAAKLPAGRRRRELEAWLADDIHKRFEGRILGVDSQIAIRCGHILAAINLDFRARRTMDIWMAAIALQHDLTLVTRNVRDFQETGVKLYNPWQATSR